MPSAADLTPAVSLLEQALADQVFSGAVLDVGDGGAVVFRHALGRTARVPVPGVEVTPDTWFDLASITKAFATSAVVYRLIEAGKLSFDAPIATHVPGVDPRVRVRHCMEHSAGFVWWKPFFERLRAGERLGAATARDALVRMAAAEPLESDPGTRAVYSDLSYILLAAAAEAAGGARLDELAARLVFEPLGVEPRFVDLAQPWRPDPVCATELDAARGGIVTGEVHDENCHAAGGVTGHAGLFGRASDLSRFAAAIVRSWHGESVPGGFPRDLLREAFTRSTVPSSTRCLGWDTPSPPGSSQAGDLWPRTHAIGHMGFTGTSLWIDLDRSRWVVLLTNRVHPTRADERIKVIRPRVHDAIVTALEP